MKVKVAALMNPDAITLALVLTVIAIIGKLACGLAVSKKSRDQGGDRWMVGFGMIPRGEVGLIFASIGLSELKILSDSDYAAVVFMVAVTTFIAPILLAFRAKQIPANTPLG